jgi:hypothetical protein
LQNEANKSFVMGGASAALAAKMAKPDFPQGKQRVSRLYPDESRGRSAWGRKGQLDCSLLPIHRKSLQLYICHG